VALTNATVFIDYQIKVENAIVIIKDGRIENAGVAISVPADAKRIDMRGKFIYPAFIDLYSNYGVSLPAEKKNPPNGYPQFVSNKNGAYSWNEAIRSETDAASIFVSDETRAKNYREAGFGLVLTGLQDGICRGTYVLVSTGSGKEHELIVKEKAAAGFSFSKGSSTQDYPSSIMGSVALLRQTYLDASWYRNQQKEKNISLEAFNNLIPLPGIFACENKLAILRADKISKEFGARYIIKGIGDEYQRGNEIKATNLPLIIPVNFPKGFDVDDPLDAAYVSTADMKHWELAPANAFLLSTQQIDFAFTMNGCENAAEFLKNIRKTIQYGLDEKAALKALTENPARFIKMEKEIGALKKGMTASFIVCSGNIFNNQSQILETWTNGKKFQVNENREIKMQGIYSVQLKDFENYKLKIEGELNKPVVYFIGPDSLRANYTEQLGMITFSFKSGKKTENSIRINCWIENKDTFFFPFQAKKFGGKATMPDGRMENFTATFIEDIQVPNRIPDSAKTFTYGGIIYPFTDYGWKTQPLAETTIFKNATVWSNEKEGVLKETDVAIQNGKIISVSKNLKINGAREIDATGMNLTNGIIDEHSHIAISGDVNECTQAVTSEVRIGDVVNSEDINIYRQLAGGVTSSQLLHGSCNPIGGQSALIKLRWGLPPEKLKIEGADPFIKFALGENVKQSNWGERAVFRYPQSRMGVEQVYFDAFIRAKEYEQKMKTDPSVRKDLELDALVEILNNKRFITCHSYVQSEINMLMHVADSMGFKVNTFTHILEGYKVADKMKRHDINASTFADWWAYKYEVTEAIPYNAAIMTKVGLNVGINSDDPEMARRLNQEAAKTIKYGNMSEEEAWKMVTLNPAKTLHLDNRLGSIKVGKDADLVLWSDNPLSIYAKPLYTYVDGICYFSFEKDKQLQEEILKERQRLIQKLIAAKQNGEKVEKKISPGEEIYHCEN
ncbi:MAG: amidohydrolase family protein, partial [Bacteroidia bacterium]